MKTNLNLLLVIVLTAAAAPTAWAQKGIEVTPFVGGQFNSGLSLSTSLYHGIDVQNGLNYGVSASYSISRLASVEFMWNHNQSDALAQPLHGNVDVKLFSLTTNQYLGDFLLHFKDSESRLRPFVFGGAGVNNLAPNRSGVNSTHRFAWVFGGGLKYSLSKHLGVRLQAKWSPTYINTFTQAIWCDPFWAGCWTKGDSVYLHEIDATAGLTFRF
jgi:hypothetical protein